jgi:nucleotide-binding universal stress UspA family protein
VKVIIGLDSLAASGYILDDIAVAGLPPETNYLIVAATDIDPFPKESEAAIENLLQPDSASWQREVTPEERTYLATMLQNARTYAHDKEQEATHNAAEAVEELRRRMPGASVDYRVVMASPFEAIIEQARQREADLVVVGSQNASTLTRFFLGSVSQKVITFCTRPVRIARAQAKPTGEAPRLLIAFDGSPDSRRAVKAVASRTWPAGTKVKLLIIEEPRSAGFFLKSLEASAGEQGGASGRIVHTLAESAAAEIVAAGLDASVEQLSGNPKTILLEQAEQWNADTIFLGAKGHTHPNSSTLGAVATAVATRAHCSLEIVR